MVNIEKILEGAISILGILAGILNLIKLFKD